MKNKVLIVLVIVFLICFAFVKLGWHRQWEQSPPLSKTESNQVIFSENTFDGCPSEGDATLSSRSDPELNKLKNRIEIPATYEEMTVSSLKNLNVPSGVSKSHMESWSKKDFEWVENEDKRAVAVQGYLVSVKREGPESCNCHIDADRDFHIWLSASPNDNKADAIVVEVSPRVRSKHPNWELTALRRIVTQHIPVRISGWLMLDPEHPDQVGKTRATLWEIHPILKIEVQETSGWQEL